MKKLLCIAAVSALAYAVKCLVARNGECATQDEAASR